MRRASQARRESGKVIHWKDFDQAEPPLLTGSLALHIAAYFRHVLNKYEDSEFVKYLVAPSPEALTGYFRCDEEDIYAALQEIKRQGYEYETSGSASPVILWDPLVRDPHGDKESLWGSHWSTSGFNSV
jgi:hypothetical protein